MRGFIKNIDAAYRQYRCTCFARVVNLRLESSIKVHFMQLDVVVFYLMYKNV